MKIEPGTLELCLDKASNEVDEEVEDFDLEKSNILVFGPTGSGKTHIIKVRSMNRLLKWYLIDILDFG